MNKQTVGMENLPNIYIDSIEMMKDEVPPFGLIYTIDVTLMMVDHELDNSWYQKINDLKVKCAFIDDDRRAKLNSGEISLHDVRRSREQRSMRRIHIESCNDFELYETKGGYNYYKKTVRTKVRNNITDLNVYAACFLDNLGFGIELFDKFYGPMAAEKILVSGEINRSSGYFYYPETNEEYAGPVHAHNQGYMVGSEHVDEPHSGLVYVPEINFKITSNMDVDFGTIDSIVLGTATPNILPEDDTETY